MDNKKGRFGMKRPFLCFAQTAFMLLTGCLYATDMLSLTS